MCYITSLWNIICYHNLHLYFKGSCVTHGGQYKKKLKSLYILTKKCPDRHKNLDYWYLLNTYGPDTQNFNVFFTSWMKNPIEIAKVEKCSNMLGIAVSLIDIDPYNFNNWSTSSDTHQEVEI